MGQISLNQIKLQTFTQFGISRCTGIDKAEGSDLLKIYNANIINKLSI